ncbi:anhydro-N-acetylmuramic acid kinase [Peptococcaceae bacterium CEB3]|nr:anhydro-N-acetylmuramic acid kinase [Peptococcaceae bacterium CEB3]
MSVKNVLETERLTLREMTIEDLPALSDILQDEQTMYAYEGAMSDAETQEWLERQLWRYKEDGFGLWAVVLKETGKMMGQCGLSWQNADGKRVLEIGYLLNRAYWHKGYAAEAAEGCKLYAFEALNADEVYSIIRDTNTASMNIAIRMGMTIRGRFVKHYRGVDMPHVIFSVRKNERGGVGFSQSELSEAHRALLSTLHKCEKMDVEKLGKSQRTLLERRIAALKVSLALIEKEQGRIPK